MKTTQAQLVKSTLAGQSFAYCQSFIWSPQHEVTKNYYYSPLNVLLVHHKTTLSIIFARTLLNTTRQNYRNKKSCSRTQYNEPVDLQSTMLILRLLCLPPDEDKDNSNPSDWRSKLPTSKPILGNLQCCGYSHIKRWKCSQEILERTPRSFFVCVA